MNEPKFHINLFDNPSGTVRGIGNVSMEIKGKEKVIAKMTIPTSGDPEIVMEIPRSVPFDEIPFVLAAINQFHGMVAHAAAQPE